MKRVTWEHFLHNTKLTSSKMFKDKDRDKKK